MARKTSKKIVQKNRRALKKRLRRKRIACLAAAGLMGVAPDASLAQVAQLPSGADVVAGQATIQGAGNAMNVQSSTQRAIVNWDSFSVGRGNVANFNLPNANAAILNRVVTPNMPSSIMGALNSNGNVYLVNPGGVVVGSQGVVNTNGFVASTFDIANDQFMAGGALNFRNNGSIAAIVNEGTINTGTGGAHLIANDIVNNGKINSLGGNISLAGGGTVTLTNGVTYVQPSMATLASGISPTAGLIQNTGSIRATGAATIGGEVYLVNPNGELLHDGTIAAQRVADAVTTTGGHVQIEGDKIALSESSRIDATGTHGGGTVLVGGEWQGAGDMTQATSVTMEAGAKIDASATVQGDGGEIALWTDVYDTNSVTIAYGTLLANAGNLSGAGGQIETSGHVVDTSGISVKAGAANGTAGQWLIDPFNYNIDAVAASNIVSSLNSGTSVSVITTADNVSFGSSGNNSDLGDITVTSDIVTGAMSGDATLTLQAARHIDIAANIDATQNGNTAKLNVTLLADIDNSGDGINIISADSIKTNGGNLQFGDGSTAIIGGQTVKVGGDVYINGSVAQSLESGGGAITVNGETIVANSSVSGVTFDSDGGNIVFDGLLNSGNQYTYVDGPDGQSNAWDWARTDARNGGAGGASVGDSYLVTITSRLENAIAGIAADYRGAWIGAYRSDTSSYNWQWADGPEAGQTFFVQSSSGSPPNGGGNAQPGWYANFGPNEPNGNLNATGETRGQFFGDAGLWNDLPTDRAFEGTQVDEYSVLGYVRETNLNPTVVTIDAGATGTVTMGGIGSGKALSSFAVTSAGVTVNGDALITTGTQIYDSALTVNSAIGLNVEGTTLTTGGALNFTAADDITIDAAMSVPGSINIQGDEIAINGNLTSTDTGDIYVQSNSATTGSIVATGDIAKTGGDRSTLTLRGDGRVTSNAITASGGAVLDTVLWSDYHDDNQGGTSIFGDVNTNGGHLWAGGSATDGGSTTWNGLTVGDGASVGASGANHNGFDLYANITTGGGDVALVAGLGFSTGIEGIGLGANHSINSGTGNISLIADDVDGAVLTIDSTGQFTFAPNSNAWSSAAIGGQLDYTGSISSDTFTGTSDIDWLTINSYSGLTGLTLGKEGNTSSVAIYNPISIAGPVSLIGDNITLNEDITTTAVGSDVLLKASGDIAVSSSTVVQTNNGDITLWSDSDFDSAGEINIANNVTFNSANGSTNQQTGGGDITFGGGEETDGRPNGFAASTSDHAIEIGTGDSNTASIYSGGGNVSIKGKRTGSSSSWQYGILSYGEFLIDSGQGAISLDGRSSSKQGLYLAKDYSGGTGASFTSAATSGTAIDLYGSTGAFTSQGIRLESGSDKFFQATGGGDIQISGNAQANGKGIIANDTHVLASTGDISLDGGTYGISASGATFGQKAGSAVTAASGDVVLTGNAFAATSGTEVATTGSLTIQPSGTSFSDNVSLLDSDISVGTTLSSLTVGKDGNTETIVLGSDITTVGPQTYFGPLSLSGNVALSTTNSDVIFDKKINSDGTARSLTVNPGTANVTFDGDVGATAALSSLTVDSTADVEGDVTTTGAQNWTDTITFGAAAEYTLDAGSLTTQEIVGGASDLNLVTDGLTLNDTVSSTGDLVIRPKTGGTTVGVGSGTGTLSVNAGTLSLLQDGFSSITIGGTSSGDLSVGDLSSLQDDLVLQAGSSANLLVTGALSWNTDDTLTLAAGNDIHVLANLDVGGSAAGLNLYYGNTDGSSAPDAADNFYINLADSRRIRFANTGSTLNIGNEAYTLLDSVSGLQSMAASGRYALTGDLDLFGTTYTDAFYTTTFTGKLDGLGNVVDGLTIRDSDGGNLGLFARINGGTARHLGVTNIDIKTDSSLTSTDFRIGGLVGNVGGLGSAVSNETLLDGVWSSGAISTESGSQQGIAFFGGLVGNQNGGTMLLTRSFSTANISTQGSDTATGLGIGGLIGDISLKTTSSFTDTTSATIAFDITTSYATGSIVQGTFGGYYGAGGILGVNYASGNTISDSYSWGNVVGTGSFGGIAGYGWGLTASRVYTKQDSFGNTGGTGVYNNSYTSDTLDAATSNGTALPATWSSDVWTISEFPTLSALRVPPTSLFVKILAGNTSTYGDTIAPNYEVVDGTGTAVAFGSGIYADVGAPTGTGIYTIDDGANADTHDISYLRGLALTGDDANFYALNPFSTAGSYIVTPRSITAVLANTGVDKVYDGNVNAGSGYTPTWSFTNILAGDSATLNTGGMFFNDADVLEANLFTIDGLSLAGIKGSNGSLITDYSLSSTSASVAANITAKHIVINGLFADDKIYDGNNTASIDTDSVTYSGIVSGDSVSLDTLAGTFVDKNVAADKNVSVTGMLTGTDASNYTTTVPSSLQADITPLSVTVLGVAADNKVYDSTANATLSGTAVANTLAGDSVSLETNYIANFANSNAADDVSVAVTGFALTGTDSANYSLDQPTGLTADITTAPLLITANNDSKFVTKSDLAGYAGVTFDGFVGSQGVGDLSGSLSISRSGSDEAAGIYSGVLSASGLTSTNYAISYSTGDYTIVPAEQFLIRFGNSSTTYGDPLAFSFLSAEYMDAGNSVSSLTPTVTGNQYSFGDGVGGMASFTLGLDGEILSSSGNINVGTYGLVMNDVSAIGGNFDNNLNLVGSHTIDRANLITGTGGVGKTYDGTGAMNNLSLNMTGLVTGDDVIVSGQGNYSTSNAGIGKTYLVENLAISGSDANNYTLPGGTSLSGSDGIISPKSVTITAPSVTKVYDGNANIDATTSQLLNWSAQLGVSGDTVDAITLTYDDKNVGTEKTLTPSAVGISDGNGGSNYDISFADSNSSSITRLATVTWTGGATGDWSDPNNWTGGAVPDLANVENVIVPDGVTPVFDSSVAGPVDIESLLGGSLQMDSGTMNVAQDATLQQFTQNGGIFNVGGNFTVDDFTQSGGTTHADGNMDVLNSFTQGIGGSVDVTGNVDIVHTTGLLTINDLTGGSINLHSTNGGVHLNDLESLGDLDTTANGDLTQDTTGTVVVAGTSTFDINGNVTLDGPNNEFQGLVNITANNVLINDSHGDLTFGNVQVPGNFSATATNGRVKRSFNGTDSDEVFSKSIQSSVYDTNTRHDPTSESSGLIGTFQVVLRRVAEITRLTDLFAKFREPLIEADITIKGSEVYVERNREFDTKNVNTVEQGIGDVQ